MKDFKILFLFLSLIILISWSSSASTAISGDPYTDAAQFAKECVAAARQSDFDKINELAGKYYEYYNKQDLADRLSVMKAMQSDKYFSEEDAQFWHSFVENERLNNLPNVIRWDMLFQRTMEEAKEQGIWDGW